MNNEYSPKRSSMWLAPAWCRSPANGQCFNRKITHFVCMCTYCDCDPRHSGCNSDKVPSAENIKYRSLSEDPLRKSVQQTVRDWTGAGNEYSPKRSSMWLAPAWCRSPANGQCFNRKITHFVCMCTYCDCDPRHSGCNSDKVPSAENIKYRSLSEDPLRKSVQQTVRDWTGAGKHSEQRLNFVGF